MYREQTGLKTRRRIELSGRQNCKGGYMKSLTKSLMPKFQALIGEDWDPDVCDTWVGVPEHLEP